MQDNTGQKLWNKCNSTNNFTGLLKIYLRTQTLNSVKKRKSNTHFWYGRPIFPLHCTADLIIVLFSVLHFCRLLLNRPASHFCRLIRLHSTKWLYRPVYSDVTQLSSTSSWVELSCVGEVSIATPMQLNSTRLDWPALRSLAVRCSTGSVALPIVSDSWVASVRVSI